MAPSRIAEINAFCGRKEPGCPLAASLKCRSSQPANHKSAAVERGKLGQDE